MSSLSNPRARIHSPRVPCWRIAPSFSPNPRTSRLLLGAFLSRGPVAIRNCRTQCQPISSSSCSIYLPHLVVAYESLEHGYPRHSRRSECDGPGARLGRKTSLGRTFPLALSIPRAHCTFLMYPQDERSRFIERCRRSALGLHVRADRHSGEQRLHRRRQLFNTRGLLGKELLLCRNDSCQLVESSAWHGRRLASPLHLDRDIVAHGARLVLCRPARIDAAFVQFVASVARTRLARVTTDARPARDTQTRASPALGPKKGTSAPPTPRHTSTHRLLRNIPVVDPEVRYGL